MAKENEDRLDGDLPKDVLYDQREVNFVEAEDDGQTKAGMGTSKSGKEFNVFFDHEAEERCANAASRDATS